MGSCTSNVCKSNVGMAMLPADLFVVSHLLESSGRDVQTFGEKIRLLEVSVEKVGHLILNRERERDGE